VCRECAKWAEPSRDTLPALELVIVHGNANQAAFLNFGNVPGSRLSSESPLTARAESIPRGAHTVSARFLDGFCAVFARLH